MEYIIGSILALAVAALAAAVGFDRDRAFFPTILMVIASYYILFAAMGASMRALAAEAVVAAAFSAFAIIGYKRSVWWVAAAITGHGVFDLLHHRLIENPGVPPWWPGFCLAFDVIFGAFIAIRLLKPSPNRL
jgi:hypothetical protein